MNNINGKFFKSILITIFTIAFSAYVAKEVWQVRAIYEIKTDVAIIIDNQDDASGERMELNEKIDNIAEDQKELKSEVDRLKLTALKQ